MTDQYILSLLKEMMPPENHIPRAVLYEDLKVRVQKDVSAILNRLYKERKILVHRTINSIMIEPHE